MPQQIKRLSVLFLIIIIVFMIIRQLLIPESFGELGFYRANAIQENEAVEIKHVGNDVCKECHDTETELFSKGEHKELQCEMCHGPGYKHINAPDEFVLTKPNERSFCGVCHAYNPARSSENIVQVDLETHNIPQQCIECHNPHEPWKMKE